MLVLENHLLGQPIKAARTHPRRRLFDRNSNRRDPHYIPHLQSVIGTDSTLVYAHFTFPQTSIDAAFWDAFQDGEQKIIQALAFAGFVDLDMTDSRGRGLGGFG